MVDKDDLLGERAKEVLQVKRGTNSGTSSLTNSTK